MSTSKDILKQFGERLVVDLQKAVPKATGKTRDSIYLEVQDDGFTIRGGAQIGALIDGRKPTGKGAKRGSPTLQQEILGWIKAKQITDTNRTDEQLSDEQLSWVISKHIHIHGYKGKGDIFGTVLTQGRFDSLTKTLLDFESSLISSQVVKEFKL